MSELNNKEVQVTEVTQEVTEQKTIKKMLGLKIVTAIIFGLVAIWFAYSMISIAGDLNSAEGWEGLGIAIVLVLVLALGGICLAASLVLSLVGLIISIVRKIKKRVTTGTLIYFIVFTVLPIVIFFFSIGLFKLLT